MDKEIRSRITDFFQEIDDATNSPETAATALATITACLGLYLNNNFLRSDIKGLVETIAEGIEGGAKLYDGLPAQLLVIQGNKK